MSSKKTRGRGRPVVDSERVDTRFPREALDGIDAFAAAEPDKPARTEAVRRIVRGWLIVHGYMGDGPAEGTKPQDLNASKDD